MRPPFIFLLLLSLSTPLPAANPSRFVQGCLSLLGRTLELFSPEAEPEPLKGIPEQNDWLKSNPELRTRLEKLRGRFLKMRQNEFSTRKGIPKLKEINLNGKTFPVIQFLGAGYGSEGAAYIAKDGNKERYFKVYKNKDRFESHRKGMQEIKDAGVPVLESLEVDPNTFTIELEPKIGLSMEVLGYSAVENYGLSLTDVQFIEAAYRTQFEVPNRKKLVRIEFQNVLLELSTGRFFIYDPH